MNSDPNADPNAGLNPGASAGLSAESDEFLHFVRAHTRLRPVPGVPEVSLHLAEDAIGLWQETERAFGLSDSPPPFWAFAWAGGQALARYILDNPAEVSGARVIDLASGSGLVAIAAARAGAAAVTANDLDPLSLAAIGCNAAANAVHVTGHLGDLLAEPTVDADVVLAGDIFYERATAARMLPFLRRAWAGGARVLVGDPGRTYLPPDGFVAVASYRMPVPVTLEDAEAKQTTVWRLVEDRPSD
ncbi:class I SAM-dependent methyltransferase [Actinopolymorpha singaporensis]